MQLLSRFFTLASGLTRWPDKTGCGRPCCRSAAFVLSVHSPQPVDTRQPATVPARLGPPTPTAPKGRAGCGLGVALNRFGVRGCCVPSVCLSVCLSICPSVCLGRSVGLSLCPSVPLSLCPVLSVCLSVCPSVSLCPCAGVCVCVCARACAHGCAWHMPVYVQMVQQSCSDMIDSDRRSVIRAWHGSDWEGPASCAFCTSPLVTEESAASPSKRSSRPYDILSCSFRLARSRTMHASFSSCQN